ncbi:unnamed protein product [Dovyalis caffra]|uniref:Sulfotransferase n=1 Tax=Dovyalis caffra TaxID=77055 RepID=A0AAV1RME1_9ROSI|nr:unnamed protein product [Dovyalis caffra]
MISKICLQPFLVRKIGMELPFISTKGSGILFLAIRGALSFQRHFIAQDTDIILGSMPKSGTTWLKAITFSVVNRNIYSPKESPLLTTPPHELVRSFEMDLYSKIQLPDIEKLPSPRIFFTQKSSSQISKNFPKNFQNPLDQLVSYFHFARKFKRENVEPLSSIDEGFDNVCRGVQSHGPFWDSVLGYWKASIERPDKVLFLKYEDLKEDISFNLKKLGEFLGFPFSEKEKEGVIEEIPKLCSFDNPKDLEVNKTGVFESSGAPNSTFFRKAKLDELAKNGRVDPLVLEDDCIFHVMVSIVLIDVFPTGDFWIWSSNWDSYGSQRLLLNAFAHYGDTSIIGYLSLARPMFLLSLGYSSLICGSGTNRERRVDEGTKPEQDEDVGVEEDQEEKVAEEHHGLLKSGDSDEDGDI